jgi:Ubiquitin-activating enzyme E1 FCCH domain
MSEYSKMVKGRFTTGGTSAYVNLPFQPDFVELWNYTNIKAAVAANKTLRAWWDVRLIDGSNNPTMLEVYTAGSVTAFDTIQTNGISSFYAGLSLQYGPVVAHGGSPVSDFSITAANPAVVTTVGNHGLNSGDVVVFQNLKQSSTTGMQQIAGIAFAVTVTGATTFSIPWNASGSAYTAFNTATSTGNVGSYKKVLYPYLYAPGVSIIGSITNGATTTISTTSAHNFFVGQEIAIRIPNVSPSSVQQWGPTQFNSLPNTVIPGSPIYGYVTSVTDYHTVVVNINSSSYSTFSVNIPFSSVPGLSFPQIVAVGDVNTGGVQISANSALYPPLYTVPIGTTSVNTINGPAIQGAFFNNTSQGFFIGAGAANNATGVQIMAANDFIEWRAFIHG